MATCRLVLCYNSTSKVIPAIKSRCLGVRVAAPTNEEVIWQLIYYEHLASLCMVQHSCIYTYDMCVQFKVWLRLIWWYVYTTSLLVWNPGLLHASVNVLVQIDLS